MKCIGYDEAFMRGIVEKLSTWKPEPKENKKTLKRAQPEPTASRKRGTKRKHSDVSKSSGKNLLESEDEGDTQGLVYVPRGTRSRPNN
jgi:hypothetical protein